MKRRLQLIIAAVLFSAIGYAQNTVWNITDNKGIAPSQLMDRASVPSTYHLFHLDLQAFKAQLANAPLRGSKLSSNVIVQFPDGNGQLKSFTIYEAPVMQPALAVKYPNMKSYVGQGVAKPSETIRFSITMYGLHTMMFTNEGTSYTDTYTKDLQTYIVYKRSAVEPRAFRCDVTEANTKKKKNLPISTLSVPVTDGTLRTYRLAMACTVEYAAFHIEAADLTEGTIEEKTEAVLAAMNVTVTRINSIYERDFSITMQLVANNDELIFIDDDNFDNENTDNALLGQSQETIDSIIGFDNYDIGHTVSTGGGGVAQLYSPCSESKATGITGLGAPVGDAYDIDFVAHEMGHQFGGNHTFNNSCDGNRNDDTAYETGSGSTIMAYAGVCFPSVQDHSDAHFHRKSIQEITDFMKDWGNCAENTATNNDAPVADAGIDVVIPKGTPFILKGVATDSQGNSGLTYCWEQMDKEISEQPPLASAAAGPNFRSLPPNEVPERYMPELSAVLDNNLTPTWEVISDVARTFNFTLTVRDNSPLGGQTAYDDMVVTVSDAAGPFLVTVPNTNVSWEAGSNQTVTWDVAGTAENGINTAFVDILFSNDGGLTYPVVLASQVPNDGNETIIVPNNAGATKRIMVRGYGNIFYDISNTNFTVTQTEATFDIVVSGEQNKTSCKNSDVVFNLNYETSDSFAGETNFTVSGNPEGSAVSFDPALVSTDGPVTVTVSLTDTTAGGLYPIIVTAASGNVSKTVSLYLEVIESNFGDVILTAPVNDAITVPQNAGLKWEAEDNATSYQVEVATDADFENIVTNETVIYNSFIANLAENTMYYWRVTPFNTTCAGAVSNVYAFKTGGTTCTETFSLNVPANISDAEMVTVNSTLNVPAQHIITTAVVHLKIDHTYVSDLKVFVKSPAGTVVTLFDNVCGDADNIDATFTDDGVALVCGSDPVVSGMLMPLDSLSVFADEQAQGIWTLTVIDTYGQDGGKIVSWGMEFCDTEDPLVAGVQSNIFTGLSVYPNPNKGDFTVRFTPSTGSDIKISVYDIRGRQLFNKSFANTDFIEQSLSLGNVQSGVYLVTIQDGDATTTKKIIVQ